MNKQLIKGIKNKSGRNHSGKITVYHKGGKKKRRYRLVSFKKNFGFTGKILGIEYDPNRNAFIAKANLLYDKKKFIYTIASNSQRLNSLFYTMQTLSMKKETLLPSYETGHNIPLRFINSGLIFNNVEIYPNRGSQIARAAGTSARVIQNFNNKFSILQLPSKCYRLFNINCSANLGQVSNSNYKNIILKKAGRNRWRGKRPTVRGVAMNPVDHPHGGGEGKTSGGRPSVTPWGLPTKGKPTRKNNNINNKFIFFIKK